MDDWDDLVPHHFMNAAEARLSQFCFAAQEGDVVLLTRMLNRKDIVDVNQQSPKKKETALHYACRSGKLDIIKFLVDKGADVNIKDIRGKHSLHLAASSGHLECVKYLVDNHAEMDIIDKYNRSCLHWASVNKHFDVVIHLLEKGAPVTYSISNHWQPLHEAVKGGDVRIAEALITKGAPVNPPPIDNSMQRLPTRLPFTPLHIAAREGHLDCLTLLLKHRAIVNAINQGKQTPLHEAAFKGNERCVQQLIFYGADPHAKNDLERTPLLDACNQGHLPCAILLLDAGSKVNAPDRCGETALHHLLRCVRISPDTLLKFVDILLQYGANVNGVGRDEETPLMLANMMGERDVMDAMHMAMDTPCSLRHYAKIASRKILRCDYTNVSTLGIPKSLEIFLLQNSSVFSGW